MKNLFIQSNKTIKDALKQLNKVGEKCLVVVNNDEKYLGTLSDGDLRKSILKGESLKDTIENIYNMQSTFLIEGKYTNKKIKKIFLKYKFDLIPIINSSREIVKILFWEKVFNKEKTYKVEALSVPVVIMAGGKGTRLEPFTKILPKPLVPVHEKPIIEHIIERFTELGCNDFHLMV
ncbi:MAG: sugar phosphate nucleotidyltransferase, partial [SAR202 cluster bacterium]|nr:sugar phosphate nucleotidyltransferase [SAR202 cluster bacterium]